MISELVGSFQTLVGKLDDPRLKDDALITILYPFEHQITAKIFITTYRRPIEIPKFIISFDGLNERLHVETGRYTIPEQYAWIHPCDDQEGRYATHAEVIRYIRLFEDIANNPSVSFTVSPR